MQIKDVVLEIKNYKNHSIHKSALDIYQMLNGNRMQLNERIGSENMSHLLKNFEQLSYAHPKEYTTSDYKREYDKNYDLLLFYLDRIV